MLLEPSTTHATNATCQSIISCEVLLILAGGLVIFAWWFFAKIFQVFIKMTMIIISKLSKIKRLRRSYQ